MILETYNEKAKEKVAFLQIQNYCIESFENGQAVMADGGISACRTGCERY